MIYTVTLNPAIDYIMNPYSVVFGATNRSASENYFIGGKGINVSRILKELGVSSTALGFVAGFTGRAIQESLEDEGIKTDFVQLEGGFTRINVKLKGDAETEINGKGPAITTKALEAFYGKLDKVKNGDTVVIAGSIPSSCDADIYESILARLHDKDVRFAVDTTGELLKSTLCYRPFVIKPNLDELSELFGKRPENDEETVYFARLLQNEGARNVIVSMGKNGAVLLDEKGGIHRANAHSGKAINSVGAGDSMLAGFLAGYEKSGDLAYALKLGNAAGAATAFSYDLASGEMINELAEG